MIDSLGEEALRSWEAFLSRYASLLLRLTGLYARSHDDRMDLFLHLCTSLRDDDMRRVRSFRFRPEAPCRFETWLSVVARNLATDWHRSRHGRFRPFSGIASMQPVDRLIFEYGVRDRRSASEIRDLLASNSISLDLAEVERRLLAIESSLTPVQRWRLLARWAERQQTFPIDPVSGVAEDGPHSLPLESAGQSPERKLREASARRVIRRALDDLPPRQRLILALRFRDGLGVAETARTLHVSAPQVERATHDALTRLRDGLRAARLERDDVDGAIDALWASWEESA